MLKHYLTIAWRNLFKSKSSAIINIGGLAVGMAVAILIAFWIWDELSYNKSFKNYSTIAQVMTHETSNGETETSIHQVRPLEFELRNKYGSSFKHIVMARYSAHHILSFDQDKIMQLGQFMQAGAPDMLSLEMLEGSKDGLKDPASILISASTAQTYFGNASALNKTMKIDNRMDVKVTGVYKDLPYNTEFSELKFIAPWDLLMANEKWMAEAKDIWDNHSFLIYVQINPNTTFDAVSDRIRNAVEDNVAAERKKYNFKVFLNPMSRWHLYSKWENGVNVGGRIQYVWLFGIIGAFVLLLACINFMNLSTARSEKRAKEVGVRKAVGSNRVNLIKQFLGESFLVVWLAFLLALMLVTLALPWFNEIADKEIKMLWLNPVFWVSSIVFIGITGLVAGSYPAFYLSSFQPVRVFKGSLKAGRYASVPRRVLVVLQFTVSVSLIIGTIIVFKQIQHAKDRKVGYSGKGLIAIRLKAPELKKKYEALRTELKNSGLVLETCLSSSPLTGIFSNNGSFNWKDKDPNFDDSFGCIWITHDYGKTVGWELKEGRDFSRQFASDVTESSKAGQVMNVIINEAAAKYMKLRKPVGEIITWSDQPFRIVGVVKDMVSGSPYAATKQTLFFVNNDEADEMFYLRLNPTLTESEAIKGLEKTFRKIVPSVPFEYNFADVEHEKKFRAEERIGELASIFASLAILISCLGLLGLASFVAEQRSKEISIRKVLGATITALWGLLSKEFIILVAVSCLLAFPIAGYVLNKWLLQYEFHTELSWWIFASAGGGAVLISLITVSYQAIKAAVANPVKNLRSE